MTAKKRRVLFLCVGNSCRSQMAEGFARAYGSDVLTPASAGLAPASYVAPQTVECMSEKNIDVRSQFPKAVTGLRRADYDLVINMSGHPLPGKLQCRDWAIQDPIGRDAKTYRKVRDQIERLVMDLILELRRDSKPAKAGPPKPHARPRPHQ